MYFNNGESSLMHEHGWHGQINIGQSAMRATHIFQTLLPDGKSMLTPEEMQAGMDHINSQPGNHQ